MALERSVTAAIAGAAVLALAACSGGDETQDTETSETLQSLENVRDTSELPKYVPGQVLVRFEDDAAEGAVADQLLQRHQSFATIARAGFAIYDSLGRKTGAFTVENIAAALDYASTAGATVITMSLGGYPNPVTQEAVENAAARGSILVAAAGNSNSSSESYPAAYPEVIAVAATGPDGSKSSFSNFGRWVDVAAPGGEATGASPATTLPGSATRKTSTRSTFSPPTSKPESSRGSPS